MPRTQPKLILASGSPRRADLLRKLGIDFEVRIPDIPETRKEKETPKEFVRRLSMEKAFSVITLPPSPLGYYYILGADTIVVLENKIFGKPGDADEVRAMLKKLSGKTHQVLTAFSILQAPDKIVCVETDVSHVRFKLLLPNEIKEYIATGEPMDKAGAYAYQGNGSQFIEKIEGSETNVIGLPMEKLVPWLRKLGFNK